MDLETYGHTILNLARHAFPACPSSMQDKFALDKFIDSLGSIHLSCWLKAMKPLSLEQAIDWGLQWESAANYGKRMKSQPTSVDGAHLMQALIGDFGVEPQISVAAAYGENRTESTVSKDSYGLAELLKGMSQHMEALTKELSSVKSKVDRPPKYPRGPIPPEKLATMTCHGCGELGHIKPNCPYKNNTHIKSGGNLN